MYGIQVLSILFSAVAFLPLVLSDTEVNAEDHACGGDLTAPYGTIRSPGVINSYQANLNCTWRITTQTGNKIKFYIKKMELGGSGDCSAGDYVLAEDPVISKSTRFCDSIMDKGRTFESTRNFYSLAFISDNIVNADENGFEISYTTAAIPNCDEDFCDNRGECSGNNTCNCFSPHVGYRCLYEKSNVDHAVYSESVRNLLHYENQDEAVCAVFGMDHIMTFQGSLETFTGNCIYLMARFTLRGEYVEVMLKRNSDCYSLSTSCTDAVIIESQSQELTINRNGAVQLNKESISLPSNPPPYEIQRPTGQIIKVKIESAKITVDLTTFRIMLTVPRSIVNQTKGLCEYNSEDYLSIVDKYIRPGNKDCSPSLVHNQQVCDKENIEVEEKICDLLYTSVFAECRLHIPVDDYYHACVGDTCRCDVTRNADCHCSSVAAYASECSRMHIPVGNWRSESLCSPGCPGNQVFVECSDSCTQPTCRLPNVGTCDLNKPCTEACVCPDDTYWYEEKQVCLPITECPCYHAESTHAPGAVIDDQCNTCTCTGSVWKCTENPCSGLALVSGFGHFTTFDGLMYTYQSVCEYIYAYDCSDYQDFAIYIKTEPCGASNEFTCLKETQIFSYTSLSTSNANEKSVTLVKGGNILVNKKLAIDLPLTTGAISVHRLSSNYIAVDIEHVSVTVIWDGQSMIEVIVPPKLKGQVCGLGGKYDEKSANDLTTRNNLIAKSAFMFSESWIIPHLAQPCPRIPLVKACQQNEELAIKAREVCSIICSSTFSECQEKLNCEKFQANCEEDVCSCSSEMNCECAAVAVFALECATFGKVFIPWRTEEFCPMSCPSTQEYRAGATFCGRTCRSLMETETCSTSLKAEGCSCPDGKYLDKDSETCVAIKDCSCYVDQGWISPGAIYQENSKPCYCINGKIECNKNNQVASEREIICPSYMEKVNCSIGEQETKCLRTCENKGQYCLNSECKPVCVCPGGLVYHKGQCIEETTCPCKIFDIEHEVGTTTKSGCETIVCTEQGWDVIDRTNCYSTCSLVGGAYYQTFDNRRFNFRGTCEYVMATDDCDVQTQGSYEYEFRITAQSRDCPQSNKAMCETEVHVTIGIYKVILAKGVTAEALVAREVTDYGLLDWYLTVHKIGMYTIVDAHRNISTDYRHYKEKNIVVAWDGNTKTYIKFNNYMSPEYNVKTCGLCGDNDGDFHNDFKTSTKNTASSSAECGNSWKVDSRCADVNSTVQVTCGSRRSWAQQKCDILLTDAFAECRDVVEIDYFYETCVTETCSCESGGDCDCFCTAVSAYAYACADAGVIVQWRLPSICPTMCESYNTDPDCVWKYRPCQLCIKTCCTDRCFPGCFEGCYASCPDGTVYDEITNSCIKEEECNKTQCIKELVSPKCPSKMHQMIEYETEWINIPSQLKSINGIEFTLGQIEKYFNTSCEYPANMQCQPPPKTVIQDNVICDAKKGFKCLDYLQADGKFCLDYIIRLSCKKCQKCECDRPDTCPNGTKLQVIEHENDCCPKHECVCEGCYHGNQTYKPNENWISECINYTCISDGADCYKPQPQHLCLDDEGPEQCPEFAIMNIINYAGGCCKTHECVCKIEKEPECKYPKVVKAVYQTVGELNCTTYECGCPEADKMNRSGCMNTTSSCKADGCTKIETNDCACITSNKCECNPDDCPTEEVVCPDCHNRTTIPAADESYPDRCADNKCCASHQCVPMKCDKSPNITCEKNERKVETKTSTRCCPEYECICEGCLGPNDRVILLGGKWNINSDECNQKICRKEDGKCVWSGVQIPCKPPKIPDCRNETFVKLETKMKNCCSSIECVCKIEKEPECKYPKVVKAVYKTVGELNCTTYECGCPEADKMNRSGCMNTTSSCKADGCTKIETNDCACITSSKCECNPDDCPTEEVVCPDCYNRTTIPAADESYPDRCADNKCCASHQCVPMKCDKSPNITCEKNERKVETKTSTRCCPEYECICEGCLGPNDRVILLGGKWNINSDECNQKICRKEDGKCVWSGVQIPCKPPKIPDCRNETFVKLETKMKNCCSSIECVCKIEKEPECKYPKVVKAVYKTVGELNCTTYECGCPEADKMNRSGCMNTTSSCKADGCTKIETNDCACITSSKCECNPDDCPTEEVVCPDCYNRTTIPAADESYPDRCADNKCCASHQCVPMKCDKSPNITCEKNERKVETKTSTRCCPEYECICEGCLGPNDRVILLGGKWNINSDECNQKICRKEDGKCVWSGVQIPCKPPKIPDCRNETFVKLETKMKNCCSSIECVCKIEKEPECKYPKVVKAVYKTVGELNCTTYECGCPEADKMNRSGCMNTTSSCKADGCTKIETNDCACITSSKCECNPDDCPTEEVVCPDCYNRTTIPAADESYPDRCADNKCCASHQCVPMKCDKSPNITCEKNERKVETKTSTRCCPEYECICEGCLGPNDRVILLGGKWNINSDECNQKICRKEDGKCVWSGVQIPCKPPKIPDCRNETFVKLETKMKNCCSSIECVCKIEKEPECKYPKVVKAVYKTVGELNCTTYECGCPEADKMNRSGCMNTTSSCKADGCTKIETNDCACITSSKCECNPDDCPTEEVVCPDCYNRTTIPAADESYPDRCADNKCCASHQCVPMKCDESDVTCASCQDEIFADVDSCCPKRTCGKMFCEVGNGKKKYVNETWHDENDSCLMKTCTMSSSSDKCPSVIEHDLTSNCTIMTQKCHACQMSVISVENCCEINRCECNTDMARLGSTECSDSCSQLVVDKEASLEGCCTKYKCVQACKENGICRKENETWNRDYQCGSYHKCKCSGSGCDIVKVHPSHCEYYEYPTCVAGGAMMYTDPTKPCCPKVECPCICQTFGDPHYMTFDGSFYTFHGECQYTLVKYRHSKRLHIYSDNYVCGKYDDFDTTCLESVYVKWDDTLIKINMTSGNNIIGSVFVNNHALKSIPWKAGGIEISGMFSAVFLHIKEIDLHLRYTAFGLPAVLVQVPFSEFYNKTVGLCGTCTNLQEDDFELKDTSINPNIQEFGSSWKTDSNESCPQLPPPTCLETNTCPTPCVEDDCDVLLSESFKACHLVVYPERYYNACKYDVQVLGKCSSCSVGAIRSYAEACFEHNVCIKWKTKCPDTCSGDLVFRECVSECEIKKTCQNLDVFGDCTSTKSLSGCFCPSGTVPRTTGSSECVKKDDNCCDMPSSTDVTCVPPLVLNCTDKCGQKQCCCPTKVVCNQNVNCPDGCMTNVTKYDQCNCPLTTECVCNKDLCPKPPVCGDCHELREIVATNSSNKCSSCCPIYQCVHVPCVPDWKKKKVPVGYILVPTASRCCYNLTCDVCFTANDTIIEKGKSKTFKENGCRVEYQCTGDRNFSDSNKCFQLKTNRIDEPCQTAKEYSEKNCKLGQRAVIVDSNDTCCDAYKCECESDTYLQSICSEWNRTAGTCCNLTRVDSDSCCPNYIEECEKEPHQNHCSYIGEIRIMVDKPGFCHKQPECVCTNNSLQLQLECPSYNFKKYSCSDKDCTLVAKTKDPASSNPYTRCCPDYETVCNFTDVVCEDYQIKVERRVCETPKNVCECNSCYSEANDNYYAVGENWSEANNDGSCNFYQCDFNLNERDELGCFKPMPLENQCPQSQECSEYQERQAIPTKDSCCSEYECICKEESKLKALCSKVQSNNDFCNQPGMQNSTYLIKDTSDCCYNTNCSCLTGQELINTCFPLNSFKTLCSYGKSINMLSSSEDCCRYNCSCDMCPPGYNRTKPVAKKCFEVVSLTPQENDRQDCCPKWKLIQKYNTENCPNYTCSNFEKPVLLDSVNENCCREHKCVCDDDSVLATTCPQWHNFTCQTGYERQLVTPQNRTENHCCPEYKCVCKFCVDDDMIILPNHSWRSHNDSCSTSTCTINEATGCPEVTTSKTYNCPPVNVTECLEEGKQVYKNASTNYCCEYCDRVLAPCRPHRKRSILNATIDGIPCRSSDPVDISYCEGGCTTLSSLNEDISKANDQCRCCKPAVSFRRTRKLSCSDGKTRNYKSTEIMTCTCEETKCKLPK